MTTDSMDGLRSQFLRFADLECGRSPLYRTLAHTIAESDELLSLAATARHGPLPNLFLAAIHDLLMRRPDAPLAGFYATLSRQPSPPQGLQSAFIHFALAVADEVEELLRVRLVQTNEVLRALALYTALAWLAARERPASLALVEVGTSAGLLLAVDRYAYWLGPSTRFGDPRATLTLEAGLRGNLPATLDLNAPISRRIGIDLHALDVNDEADRRWLRALVWGDQPDRLRRLDLATEIARDVPLEIHEGDANALLPGLIDSLEAGSHAVIFHSHTLNQFPPEARATFDAALASASQTRPIHRIAMEYDGDTPAIDILTYRSGSLAAVRRLARYDAHGAWLDWLADD